MFLHIIMCICLIFHNSPIERIDLKIKKNQVPDIKAYSITKRITSSLILIKYIPDAQD